MEHLLHFRHCKLSYTLFSNQPKRLWLTQTAKVFHQEPTAQHLLQRALNKTLLLALFFLSSTPQRLQLYSSLNREPQALSQREISKKTSSTTWMSNACYSSDHAEQEKFSQLWHQVSKNFNKTVCLQCKVIVILLHIQFTWYYYLKVTGLSLNSRSFFFL